MVERPRYGKENEIVESPYSIRGANRLGFETDWLVENMVIFRRQRGDKLAQNYMTLLQPNEGEILADLGCGPGIIAMHFLPEIGPDGHLICLAPQDQC